MLSLLSQPHLSNELLPATCVFEKRLRMYQDLNVLFNKLHFFMCMRKQLNEKVIIDFFVLLCEDCDSCCKPVGLHGKCNFTHR